MRRPRVLRAEPELFATLRLVDRSRKGSITNISGNMFGEFGHGPIQANAAAIRLAKPGPWKCPAQHWANVIASKASCLTALDLSGNHKAPLTALKACLRAVPSSLNLRHTHELACAPRTDRATDQAREPQSQLRPPQGRLQGRWRRHHPAGQAAAPPAAAARAAVHRLRLLPRRLGIRRGLPGAPPCPEGGIARTLCHSDRPSGIAGAQVYKPEYLLALDEDGDSPYPETSGSGFEDEDDRWTYVSRTVRMGQSKLAELQQALPRRCRLTNSGQHRGCMRPWGEAAAELPAWHVWKADLYKEMDGRSGTLRGA
eukprot:scaffold23924_cov74-Phaeocystis_antarctica.AAC.4